MGLFSNRSVSVRRGLKALLAAHQRRKADRAFREAFRVTPETDAEMEDAYRLAIESIHDEVWEKSW